MNRQTGIHAMCLSAMVAASCGSGHGSTEPAIATADASVAASSAPRSPTSATATVTATPASTTSADATGYHCFSWVHGPDFSTDCFLGMQECERERLEMEHGARPTTPCKPVSPVSCTRFSRPPSTDERERCFGNLGACSRYRAFIEGNGAKTQECVSR